jgi:hypothetical protein
MSVLQQFDPHSGIWSRTWYNPVDTVRMFLKEIHTVMADHQHLELQLPRDRMNDRHEMGHQVWP